MHRTIDANICELERFIDAFESALTDSPDARVEDFAPPCTHAQYGEIVAELLRIDLERGWRCGQPSSLESYRERFREVLADPIWLAGLAFEDYRLRREAGQSTTAIEYSRRYGIDVSNWPPLDCSERSLSRSTGGAVASESRSAFTFPQVSQTFLNFELVEEIGRGAFGRVYLARQAGLANRPVALKLTPGTSVEPDRLAQLQHTNIVPIYSVHQANGFQAVCMPYLGRQTLVEVLRDTRRNGRLPRSGQELLTTVVAQHSETLAIDRSPNETAAKSAAVSIRPCRLAPSIRSRFECSSYVDAVAWIVSQVAAGVAHAHERGILHRDLKPANILLADDGRPMVLDFNLSDQLRPSTGRAAVVGGTIPYMSPEQLESLETGIGVDPRSDVYSIGVMLFELLTGRLPFEASTISGTASIALQASARRLGAPSVREFNAQTPPSIVAVVGKCLEPESANRYQSVEQLRIDLERHLEDLPLLHASDRSVRERAGKWMRRHPRLASATTIGGLSLALLAIIAVGWTVRERRFARVEAHQVFHDFMEKSAEARLPLSIPGADAETLDEGIAAARKQLARYDVSDANSWRRASENYRLLSQDSKVALDGAVAKTLQMVDAAGNRRDAPAGRPSYTFSDGETEAVALLKSGRYSEAIPLLTEWRDKSPYEVVAWMLLGSAYAGIGNPTEAEECFTTCTRLRPQFAFSYFQRGLARFQQRKFVGAIDDFGTHMRLEGRSVPAIVNRALAQYAIGDYEASQDDLESALALGATQTRIYFIRADVRTHLGDASGAKADHALALKLTPNDAASYLARGSARLATDPEGALADFREALVLEPSSRTAKQNIVHVLGDRLQRPEEARAMLDSILDTNPSDFRALASRAVLKARQGDRDGAASDAVAALKGDDDPLIILQAACAFARSASDQPADKEKALHLAARAVGAKPELGKIASADPDLEYLRESDEFKRILQAASVILSGGGSNFETSNNPK